MTQLPEPHRGNEIGTFTHYSVTVRLPEIARRMMADNTLDSASARAVERLIDSINSGVIEPVDPSGPDSAEWERYVAKHLGESWLDVPWFFAEYYFYRRILDAVDHWANGLDPFREQKVLGLEQALAPARETIATIDSAYARGVTTDFLLVQLMDAALWGNQVDLSLWPAEDGGAAATDSHADRLLIDQRPAAIRSLRDRRPPVIDVIIDNAGSELVADLLVADLLLRSDLASVIRIHAKHYPVFVSDATPGDVAHTIRHLAADTNSHLRNAGERLIAESNTERLVVSADRYWVSPLSWRDRPADVESGLADAGLIIVKGDANYRRLLGDLHWEYTTPFATAIGTTPAPLLALRTMKSEIAAGLDSPAIARAGAADPLWQQNGRWAIASFTGA